MMAMTTCPQSHQIRMDDDSMEVSSDTNVDSDGDSDGDDLVLGIYVYFFFHTIYYFFSKKFTFKTK